MIEREKVSEREMGREKERERVIKNHRKKVGETRGVTRKYYFFFEEIQNKGSKLEWNN